MNLKSKFLIQAHVKVTRSLPIVSLLRAFIARICMQKIMESISYNSKVITAVEVLCYR